MRQPRRYCKRIGGQTLNFLYFNEDRLNIAKIFPLEINAPKIRECIEGCCHNERSSQKELYGLLSGFAVKICYRYTNKYEEVEELVSEGFVKLFKNIEKFEINRYPDILSALKGWFKRILVNTCIDHYRKYSHLNRNHGLAEETENIPDRGASGIDALSYKELIESIRLLSPGYRTVFNLFVIDGLSHEEISQQLGITVGASKSNLSKARENLKKIIQKKIQFKAYA